MIGLIVGGLSAAFFYYDYKWCDRMMAIWRVICVLKTDKLFSLRSFTFFIIISNFSL